MEKYTRNFWIIVAVTFLFFAFASLLDRLNRPRYKIQPSSKATYLKGDETLFESKSREMGITIGTPADDVLKIRGKGLESKVIGTDENGLVVDWKYPDGIYEMRSYEINGISCYRVSRLKYW